MDVATQTADATATGTAPVDTAPASAPSPSQSNVAASAEKTAPSVTAAREAFDRLAAGQKPDDINKELFAPKPAKAAKAAPPATDAAKPTEEPAPVWPDSIDKKDKAVLQRAKMDPSVWSAIPPANRTKILTGLRATQAEQDRQFQAGKQAAAGKGTEAQPAAAAAGTQPQTTTEDEDEVTLPDVDLATGDSNDQLAAAAALAATGATNHDAPVDTTSILSPKDLETLRSLGGSELADTLDRGLRAAVAPLQQQNTQLLGVLEYLLNDHVDRGIHAAAADVAKLPGMDGLREGHADRDRNLTALRDKALLLHRAAGDPKGYPIGEAVKDAAASLFRINPTQAAQAALLAGMTRSLQHSPDRGDGTRNQRAAMTPGERNRQIFSLLQTGHSPEAARAAVDAA